jgi:hypothetical protein
MTAEDTEPILDQPEAGTEDPVLYKFRGIDINGLRILIDREIWFALPDKLNDPLDCQLPIQSTLEEAIQAETPERQEILRELASLENEKRSARQRMPMHKALEDLISGIGVFSLSRNAYDMLLWSHYANDHKGFCIGFRKSYFDDLRRSHATTGLLGADDVRYSASHLPALREIWRTAAEEIIQLRKSKTDPEEGFFTDFMDRYRLAILPSVLLTKSEAWKYEEEYRVVMNVSKSVAFPTTAIVEIVFGARTPARDEATIRNLLRAKEWTHVRYRRAAANWRGFSLDLKDG